MQNSAYILSSAEICEIRFLLPPAKRYLLATEPMIGPMMSRFDFVYYVNVLINCVVKKRKMCQTNVLSYVIGNTAKRSAIAQNHVSCETGS